jgi:hypothetical protein
MEATPASTAPTDREKVIAYIRSKGVVGPLTDDFIDDMDWAIRGKAFAKALAVTDCYPNNAEGAQAYIDELLALSGTDIQALPRDANVRVVSIWAESFRQEMLADVGEGAA